MSSVCFVSASRQNAFFGELLDALRHGLSARGIATSVAVDHVPPLGRDSVMVWVPHEYLPFVAPAALPTTEDIARSVVLCTEQPGTGWFDAVAETATRAGATLDLHPLGQAALREQGIDAQLLPLGHVPAWDRWGGHDGDGDRSIDVTFLASITDRRAVTLGACASVLEGRRTELRLVGAERPRTAGTPGYVTGVSKLDLLRRSQILLNVHRDDEPYFEWLRAAEAIANGAVLVTEHAPGLSPLVPGEDLICGDRASLPHLLAHALDDPAGLAEMRRHAYDTLRRERPFDAVLDALGDAVARATDAPEAPRWPGRVRVPSPQPAPRRVSTLEQVAGHRTYDDLARAATKQVLLEVRALRRDLARMSAEGSRGDVITPFGKDHRVPRVSVLLTVFDYAHVVAAAIESVARSTCDPIELVIVEDASGDASRARIREALARAPWLTGTLIERETNGGLAAARNLALRHARGELVFVLDADNVVFDGGVALLADALAADPGADFAYGLLEMFDVTRGSIGVTSWRDWEPAELRTQNFIDAMALVRRSVLTDLGGYTTDPRLHGWEDYALWCAVAQGGGRGVRVPAFVGRYRCAPQSMLATTNMDTVEARARLHALFPFLNEAQHEL